MKIDAKNITEYLESLPTDRKAALQAVRKIILSNLPKGYEENFNWGMITYEVPLAHYPNTYNHQPLLYAALASQKNHLSLYLTCAYMDKEIERKFKEHKTSSGKKLNMGKSCIRFNTLEDLPLDLVGEVIACSSMDKFIRDYEASRQ